MKSTRTGIIVASMLIAASGAATTVSAQDLTTQQKFDALVKAGVFEGTEDGTTGLDGDMTRAQFAKIAALLLDIDETTSQASTYTDIVGSEWAAGYIGAATEAGVLDGQGGSAFSPQGDITIEQLAQIMVKALDLEVDPSGIEDPSDWAQAYVQAAVSAGLIPADTDYTQTATRELLVSAAYGAKDSTGSNATEEGLLDEVGGDSANAAWSDFPYFSQNAVTATMPDPIEFSGSGGSATYNGRLTGSTASGTNLTGTISMTVDFARHGDPNNLTGSMMFNGGAGSAVFTGNTINPNVVSGVFSGGVFFDGSVMPAGDNVMGKLYGPSGQEVGGTWMFEAVGGSQPGIAKGTFAGKR